MASSTRARLVVCLLAPLLTAQTLGCGGGGGGVGGPASLANDEEWHLEVSGAESFSATAYNHSVRSDIERRSMTLDHGIFDDATPGENNQVTLYVDFPSDFDHESPPDQVMAGGRLSLHETETVYSVDADDPETYLQVQLESFVYNTDPTASVEGAARGTLEGKLVNVATAYPGARSVAAAKA